MRVWWVASEATLGLPEALVACGIELRLFTFRDIPPADADAATLRGALPGQTLAGAGRFARAALETVRQTPWRPDLVHAHGWQGALAIAHLAWGPAARDPWWASVRTVLTIPSLSAQGLFPASQWPLTGLPASAYRPEGLEHHGWINCLKGGLLAATRLTTSGPAYLRMIQESTAGCGLEEVMRSRADRLHGVRDGLDLTAWNPQTDAHLPTRYHAGALAGKSACKLHLQRRAHLPASQEPLVGVLFDDQDPARIHLLPRLIDRIAEWPLQIVILASHPAAQDPLARIVARCPGRMAVLPTADAPWLHQAIAGIDALLVPWERPAREWLPLAALRYGTVPIVPRISRLADAVADVTADTVASGTATGFLTDDAKPDTIIDAIARTAEAHRDARLWQPLVDAGMRQDVSWAAAARAYAQVYAHALATETEVPAADPQEAEV